MLYYVIESDDLERIRCVMKRLYSETRMTGDDMRDNAQVLQYVMDNTFEYPMEVVEDV